MRKNGWLFLVIFIVALGSVAMQGKAGGKDALYQEILSKSEQHDIEPIDAKIDRVWKAIPGYNGIRVNVEASYKNMKKEGKYDESKLVFEEVPPAVHLDDLEPQPIFRGNPEKPMVSLLINVAWGNEFIPPILKILDEQDVKATFFFDGSWTNKNPDLAKMIYKEGHEIGNHAYSHPDLQKRSRAETMEEITKTNDAIFETLNVVPKWFGPPSGSFNQQTVEVAHELKMKTILWTVDTVDWRKPHPTEMVNRVLSKVENGSMILMHPTDPVAKGLGTMITEIKAKGLQIGTVSELMSENRVK
ncbi:polysaccharide deacetylase family protein [Sporosarcina highlanderae]|uniref:Polysaccharide deacetylase family protein n=1 Tax=Sporosarcina highlanderae TaxID=3035916 RepID=A0ABT8JUW4_9BACL|nr:polysaccharide deacetylase family protein [Sporosarcina highlanderae]MDN4608341.1 polysaccharide deacetylase family protein [Sporosarcina highlanderae]